MPLHVRAGSTVPLGPALQWTGERPTDPIRLVVHTGRDGRFTLHEDDGETNAHETGAFSTIPLSWSEADATLTIGERSGTFAGTLAERTFEIVFISKGHPSGYDPARKPDRTVHYSGRALQVERARP